MKTLFAICSCWKMAHRRKRCMETTIPELVERGQDVVIYQGVWQLPQAERHGPFLFLPCYDAYQHLPFKSRAMCRWAVDNRYDFFWKLDDDCRIDAQRLIDYSAAHDEDYIGAEWQAGVGYASGNGYRLSYRAASVVADNLAEPYGCEDVLVGKVLREAGIPLTIDNEHFHVLAEPWEKPGPENCWVYSSPRSRADQ